MNIRQELGSYTVQNHENHSSSSVASPPEYSSPSAFLHTILQTLHPNQLQPQSQNPQSGGSGCPSSDDDFSYYSPTLTLTPHPGGENVTQSLYGLVTSSPAPVLTTATVINPLLNYTPHRHNYHLHPQHSSAITSTQSYNNSPPGSGSGSSTDSQSHCHNQSSTYDTSLHAFEATESRSSSTYRHALPQWNGHRSKSYYGHHYRKSPVSIMGSDQDDNNESCSSRRTSTPTPTDDNSRKQNHSEIEKRRRDKMNRYISELSGMIPMCSSMSRKLDKLTVLRMAVQHMKTLRGSRIHSYTEGHYKPSFLTDQELKHLILQTAEGFLFVVSCDRGRLLYVSESVSQVLNYTQSDLLGHSWFDILHPKDVAKVKEQLLSSDLAPRERFIDAKTMLPVKGNVPQKANYLCPGARRSFFCRMKCKNFSATVKEEVDSPQRRKKPASEQKYCVIHCTGYLKSWAKIGGVDSEGESYDPCNLPCLVAVGKVLNPITTPTANSKHRPVTFMSRHVIDGKFVFVDQRVTLIVGFLPQELLGTSMYDYFHHDDVASLAETHKAALSSTEKITTQVYRFRTKSANCVRLQSIWKAFRNPWTKEIEYIIAKNTLAPCEGTSSPSCIGTKGDHLQATAKGNGSNCNELRTEEIQRLIKSDVPYRKIGEQIADEVVDNQRRNDSSSSNSPASALEEAALGASTVTDVQVASLVSPVQHSSILQSTSSSSSQSPHAGFLHSTRASCSTAVDHCPMGPGTGYTEISQCNNQKTVADGTNNPGMGSKAHGISALTGSAIPHNRIFKVNENNRSIPNTRNTQQLLNNPTEEEMLYIIRDAVMQESSSSWTPAEPWESGNDEAAMAVIMSFLDADAGLGAPVVDFSGLPWPLP